MAWERKIMRIVRVRNSQKKGVLARLLTAIAEAGGNTGSIVLLTETSQHVVRDITITADDEKTLAAILDAMENNEGTRVIEVRDEVLELHQKGKIAIRSRFPIDSLTTLAARLHARRGGGLPAHREGPVTGAAVYQHQPHGRHRHRWDGSAWAWRYWSAGRHARDGRQSHAHGNARGAFGIPILLNTKDPDEIVNAVAAIAPTFAAIQLEDISAPRCFEIEERLQAMLDIPVMHDDQHGTAVVARRR
jgi:malate dehydrogenase (oxaloacetate-decarboxylating)